jgi:predicted nucleic acid-binding protein
LRTPVPRYIIDTNLYIRAWRDPADKANLKAFIATAGPHIHLHSVVAAELLAGSVTPSIRRQTEDLFIEPFERRDRVITPRHGTWKRAGTVMGRLIKAKRIGETGVTRSFFNDCLLAASAREEGLTIVTDNQRDFELINSVERVEFVGPWPGQLKVI